MIRRIRSAAIGLALVAGTAVVASAQATQPAQPAQQQHAHRAERGRMGKKLGRALFHGIKLTDAEKGRVKAVREKYKPELKQLRESAKPQLQALRAARQKGDTAAMKELWAKSAATRSQGAAVLDRMRADLRAALAPEHQAQFDQNVNTLKARVAARATKARKHLGRHRHPKTGA